MKFVYQHATAPSSQAELRELLCLNRELISPADRDEFFNPTVPSKITAEQVGISVTELNSAVQLIKKAKESDQMIVIYGDYDADGVCATSLLWEVLDSLGCRVIPYIPSRFTEGYGLSIKGLQNILKKNANPLIITVDNGVVAHDALAWAVEHKITIILTDHHQPDSEIPQASALIHTSRLCGTTVAWILARAVAQDLQPTQAPRLLQKQLDLCAIATVADMVPLRGANRSFVFHGLQELQNRSRPGLLSLIEVAGLKPEPLTVESISFQIAPRLNAAGRMREGISAVRLLCSRTKSAGIARAHELQELNVQRQQATQSGVESALGRRIEFDSQKIAIVQIPEAHQGVLGLIAGKLVEEWLKPTIVLSQTDDILHGSARSVSGIHITQLLRQAQNHLLQVGGHPMAAGLSLEASEFDNFSQTLHKAAEQVMGELALEPTQLLEAPLTGEFISQETLHTLEAFAPFGVGNPVPIFGFSAEIRQVRTMGSAQQHVRLQCEIDGKSYKVIWWNPPESTLQALTLGSHISLAASLTSSVWNNQTSIELVGRRITYY